MDFDPYDAWLGIPADRRPPTYYDLLGLAPYESDPATIEQAAAAADGQGSPASDRPAQRSVAGDPVRTGSRRVILIDPDRRAEYDAKLREHGESLSGLAGSRATGGNGAATWPFPGVDDAVLDAPQSIVIAEPEVQSAFTLRPDAKKTCPDLEKRGRCHDCDWVACSAVLAFLRSRSHNLEERAGLDWCRPEPSGPPCTLHRFQHRTRRSRKSLKNTGRDPPRSGARV